MDALEQARAEIDTVDAQLAALFERRMAAVLQVAEYKRAHGLPIYDAAREAAVLEKAAARIQQPALRPYYKDHVQHMMDLAKQYEASVLGRNRAAYQGVEGAFAHIALKALFPGLSVAYGDSAGYALPVSDVVRVRYGWFQRYDLLRDLSTIQARWGAGRIKKINPLRAAIDRLLYHRSRSKKKFSLGHEGETILLAATARKLKRLDSILLPATTTSRD